MIQILKGDCREVLKELEDESVHCVVTSPPYWGLRDYGVDGQIGLEDSASGYVDQMVSVFEEVKRVLRDDGTLWLNLGDSYAGGGNYRGLSSENTLSEKQRSNRDATGVSQKLGALGKDAGAKPKDLVGIPWQVALALRSSGWWLRSDIIWHKLNPMPESVTDRCTKAHEYIFMLVKSEQYYYDAKAIAEPITREFWTETVGPPYMTKEDGRMDGGKRQGDGPKDGTRNKRSVWSISSQPFPEAHFATFPPDLIEPCILAGCPEGGTVLDPFGGAGTTGLVADRLKRNAILIELNPQYAAMAEQRIKGDAGMFASVTNR